MRATPAGHQLEALELCSFGHAPPESLAELERALDDEVHEVVRRAALTSMAVATELDSIVTANNQLA